MRASDTPPILREKYFDAPSVFTPEALLREARRQKGAEPNPVPNLCILDPDGDIVRALRSTGRARRNRDWVCYHTEMDLFDLNGQEVGIVGCAVGASFAVLVAEEMFASGCTLLVSITSSGQLSAMEKLPCFILIDRALRDEGTSYHYLPPAEFSEAPAHLVRALSDAFAGFGEPVLQGATWTTDAPFRETSMAIEAMTQRGLLAVEMEAAALYAFAAARGKDVLCFAHVTNQMGRVEGDFEKGEADGATQALELIATVARRLCAGQAAG